MFPSYNFVLVFHKVVYPAVRGGFEMHCCLTFDPGVWQVSLARSGSFRQAVSWPCALIHKRPFRNRSDVGTY